MRTLKRVLIAPIVLANVCLARFFCWQLRRIRARRGPDAAWDHLSLATKRLPGSVLAAGATALLADLRPGQAPPRSLIRLLTTLHGSAPVLATDVLDQGGPGRAPGRRDDFLSDAERDSFLGLPPILHADWARIDLDALAARLFLTEVGPRQGR